MSRTPRSLFADRFAVPIIVDYAFHRHPGGSRQRAHPAITTTAVPRIGTKPIIDEAFSLMQLREGETVGCVWWHQCCWSAA
jgi:hypothetical protein